MHGSHSKHAIGIGSAGSGARLWNKEAGMANGDRGNGGFGKAAQAVILAAVAVAAAVFVGLAFIVAAANASA